MDRTSLVRLRWRLTGAWQWPSFFVLTIVDAAVVHWLPPAGDSEGAIGAWLISAALMLVAVGFLSPLGSVIIRRVRSDLPKAVARNYAGTFLALAVSVVLAVTGIINHHNVSVDHAARIEASERAEAWIGDHAPAAFMHSVQEISTVDIQAPQVYRSCVTDVTGTRYWCVIVDLSRPFGSGVRFAGTESNQLLEQGVE